MMQVCTSLLRKQGSDWVLQGANASTEGWHFIVFINLRVRFRIQEFRLSRNVLLTARCSRTTTRISRTFFRYILRHVTSLYQKLQSFLRRMAMFINLLDFPSLHHQCSEYLVTIWAVWHHVLTSSTFCKYKFSYWFWRRGGHEYLNIKQWHIAFISNS